MTDRPASIDEYISGFPPQAQKALEEMRSIIKRVAPGAIETIGYAIPTFDLYGRHLIHFAGYANHVGLYPTPNGISEFEEAFSTYKTGKGSVQIPLGVPLPVALIERVVRYRIDAVQSDQRTAP